MYQGIMILVNYYINLLSIPERIFPEIYQFFNTEKQNINSVLIFHQDSGCNREFKLHVCVYAYINIFNSSSVMNAGSRYVSWNVQQYRSSSQQSQVYMLTKITVNC